MRAFPSEMNLGLQLGGRAIAIEAQHAEGAGFASWYHCVHVNTQLSIENFQNMEALSINLKKLDILEWKPGSQAEADRSL